MAAVNVHDAKTHLSKLLERAEAGEEIVIARAGRPVAKLVPFKAEGPRRPGVLEGQVGAAFFEPLPEEELAAWETRLADIPVVPGGRPRRDARDRAPRGGGGAPKRTKRSRP